MGWKRRWVNWDRGKRDDFERWPSKSPRRWEQQNHAEGNARLERGGSSQKKNGQDSGKGKAWEPARKRKILARRDLGEEASLSDPGEPYLHRNFRGGSGGEDAYGRPLVTWAEGEHVVSLSSNLPSWSEDCEDRGEAYDVAFALYGRADAESLLDVSPEYLAHQSSRSLLRSLELTHQTARNLLAAQARIKKLEEVVLGFGVKASQCKAYEEAELDTAKKVSMLEQELADCRAALEVAQVRVVELKTRPVEQQPAAVPPPCKGKRIQILDDPTQEIRHRIARLTGKIILAKLKVKGYLVPEATNLTVMDLIPGLLAEESTSPIHASPPRSDDDDDTDTEDKEDEDNEEDEEAEDEEDAEEDESDDGGVDEA